MTTTTALADAFAEKIASHGNVTFVELMTVARQHGVDPEGVESLEFGACPNLYMWAGMSPAFADAVLELQRRDVTRLDPTTPLVYLIDGARVRMPLAQRPPRNGYKEPHWTPVVFNMKEPTR